MWRVGLRVVVVIVAGWCVLIGAAVLIGSGVPTAPSAATAVGRNPCALPCVYGITPGATDRLTAFDTVDRIALNRSFLTMTRTSFTLPDSVLGLLTFDQQDEQATVTSVGLWGMSMQLGTAEIGEFSDLLEHGWRPERVFLTCDFSPITQMFIIMDEGRVLTRIPLVQIGADAPVLSFTMYGVPGGADQFMDANVECLTETNWMGFASPWRYLQAQEVVIANTQ